MDKNGTSQIHLIPFDLGYIFYDVLSIDNTKNLKFANEFILEMQRHFEENGVISVKNNLYLHFAKNKLKGVTYKNDSLVDQAVCHVQLTENLYCYVLSNGIAIFVFVDIQGVALSQYTDALSSYSVALSASIQKKITQAVILNKHNAEGNLAEIIDKMKEFRIICWNIIGKVAKKNKIKMARLFSSNISYKADGLSYVLTVYVIQRDEISESELNYLMYSPFPRDSLDSANWESINANIKKHDGSNARCSISGNEGDIHFSWSAVAAVIDNKRIESYNDIINNDLLRTIIKAEMYVQSRWFIGDNSMDNVTKRLNCNLEILQRMESLVELTQAELDNEISANMHTLHKKILQKIVETSEIKVLYKSVLNQIKTQKKIKEAHDQDRKRRNSLIVNCFMAIFTASTLYKTIQDIITNEYSLTNIFIFGAMILVAIGTMIFNYYNK